VATVRALKCVNFIDLKADLDFLGLVSYITTLVKPKIPCVKSYKVRLKTHPFGIKFRKISSR
jgi:hypothetical protein